MRWAHDRPLSPVAMAIGISFLCAQDVAMVKPTTPHATPRRVDRSRGRSSFSGPRVRSDRFFPRPSYRGRRNGGDPEEITRRPCVTTPLMVDGETPGTHGGLSHLPLAGPPFQSRVAPARFRSVPSFQITEPFE